MPGLPCCEARESQRGRSEFVDPGSYATRVLDQTSGESTENCTGNVRQIGDTAGLRVHHRAHVHELNEKPKADEQRGR